MRRVAVTGLGAVTPLAAAKEALTQAHWKPVSEAGRRRSATHSRSACARLRRWTAQQGETEAGRPGGRCLGLRLLRASSSSNQTQGKRDFHDQDQSRRCRSDRGILRHRTRDRRGLAEGTSRRAAAEGSSTKHAIEGYSESLDHELRTFGIRVVLVEPAYTKTSFEENVVRPDRQLDIYDSARAGMNVILRKAMTTGDAPEIVAETILNAATAAAPKRRYAAGKMARQVSFLRRFVPESAFDKSLRKQNNLPV
jgi:NAD(P)-dependent dehydrogenase (short-subunit alcohol dehydrogenase family)